MAKPFTLGGGLDPRLSQLERTLEDKLDFRHPTDSTKDIRLALGDDEIEIIQDPFGTPALIGTIPGGGGGSLVFPVEDMTAGGTISAATRAAICDETGVTLPATPADGAFVHLRNVGGSAGTVGRNGENIDGAAADYSLAAGASVLLVYDSAEFGGWRSFPGAGTGGAGGAPYITGIAPDADQFDPYSWTPTLNNPGSTALWEITDGAIPASATLNPSTGEVSSASLNETGTFEFEIAATIKTGTGAGASCYSRQEFFIATAGDPFWANVVALLHFDGANNSTTFTDEIIANTWTRAGNARLTTAQQKFGTASLNLDGSGDWLNSSASAGYSFGTGDFTIECFIRPTGTSGNRFFWGHHTGWGVYLSVNTVLLFNGGSNLLSETQTFSIGQWYHIALTRESGTMRLFVDGILLGSVSDTTNFNTTNFRIGAQTSGSGEFLGQIDEFRITKGVARYTANFTPPATSFPNS